jgi:hypothetical protein
MIGWRKYIVIAIGAVASCILCLPCRAVDRCHAAEAGIASFKSWPAIAEWYSRFSRCDDGCVAEDLDRRIVSMLANDWQSVSELHDLSEKQTRFKRFVLKHLGGDAETKELRKVRANARSSCPTGLKTFCREIVTAASHGLAEQAQAEKSAKD